MSNEVESRLEEMATRIAALEEQVARLTRRLRKTKKKMKGEGGAAETADSQE